MTYQRLTPESAQFLAANFPQLVKKNGSASPVMSLEFDASTDESAFWRFKLRGYTGGSITCTIHWHAQTATSNNVVWAVAMGAITPNSDTQDVETDTLAATQSVTDTHLGTTAKRLHAAVVTITNLDSAAEGDEVVLHLFRDADNASDTMADVARVTQVELSYS